MQIAPMQRPRHLASLQGQERCEPRLRPGGSEAEGRHPARLPRPCPEGCREAVARNGRRQAAEAAALISQPPRRELSQTVCQRVGKAQIPLAN